MSPIDHFRYIKIHAVVSEAWGVRQKIRYHSLLSLEMIKANYA